MIAAKSLYDPRRIRWPLVVCAMLSAATAFGTEPYRVFVRALWQRGYGDAAIDYVEAYQTRPDATDELRALYDLDLARSLLVAADEAPSREVADQRLTAARSHIGKFLQEHPKHQEVPNADALLGELDLRRGQELLQTARAATDDAQRAQAMQDARQHFEAARPNLAKAAKGLAARLAKMPLPPPPPAPPKVPTALEKTPATTTQKSGTRGSSKTLASPPKTVQEEAPQAPQKPVWPSERTLVELDWQEAAFQAAAIDFYLAETYSEADATARRQALEAAANAFDDLYQLHRGDRLGMLVHLWHGQTEEQLGDLETALDIYDEVLGFVPQSSDRRLPPDVFERVCEAQWRRMDVLDRLGERDVAIDEGRRWVEQFASQSKAPGNQRVALELCKLELANAATLPAAARGEALQPVLARLTELARVPGRHQAEALRLWQQYAKTAGNSQASTFAEAMDIAQAAAGARIWEQAIQAYAQAIKLARGTEERKQTISARYEMARAQYFAGKLDEALTTAEALARDPSAGSTAPAAGALGLGIAWSKLTTATPDKKTVSESRVDQMARLVIDRWPNSPEGDEAKLTLARLKLSQNDFAGAMPLLNEIGPKSSHYRAAMLLMARVDWKLHQDQQKAPTKRDAKTPARHYDRQAVEALEKVIGLDKSLLAGDGPLPDELRDALTLLAEIHLAAGDSAQAVPLVDRLTTAAKAERGQKLDASAIRSLALALEVDVAADEKDKASAAAAMLLAVAPDQRQANSALVEYVRMVREAEGKSQSTSAQSAAVIDKLAGREDISLSDRVFLGTTCRDLARRKQAIDFLEKALRQAEREITDPTSRAARAVAQLRVLVVDLLRQEKRFDEAAAEADRLVKDNPRVLEALVRQAQVWQDWSVEKPEKLNDALVAWTRVRNALAPVQPKPPAYFDAVFNLSDCLFQQGRKSHDQAKLAEAEKLLKSTLVLYPKAGGEESLQKYNDLIERIAKAAP